MNDKKYLNEEKFQKTRKKIVILAIMVLIIGLAIGGTLVATGFKRKSDIEKKYSEESKKSEIARMENEKLEIQKNIDSEKEKIKNEKLVVSNKVKGVEEEIEKLQHVRFEGFDDAYYEREKKIEELKDSICDDKDNISVYDNALKDNYDGDLEKNPITINYYKLNEELKKKESEIKDIDRIYENEKSKKSFDCENFYMFGGFICIVTLMISGSIYISTKRRKIMAYHTQQVMPIAKEGIEEIAPSVGKFAGEIVKNIKNESKDDENS